MRLMRLSGPIGFFLSRCKQAADDAVWSTQLQSGVSYKGWTSNSPSLSPVLDFNQVVECSVLLYQPSSVGD